MTETTSPSTVPDSKSPSRAFILWVGVVLVSAILCLLTLPTYVQSILSFGSNGLFSDVISEMSGPSTLPIDSILYLVVHFAGLLAFLALGVITFVRLPRNNLRLLMSGTFITMALTTSWPIVAGPTDLLTKLIILASPLPYIAQIYIYLAYPTTRLKYVWLAIPLLCAAFFVMSFGLGDHTTLATLILWLAVLGLVVYTFYHSDSIERGLIQWAIVGLCGLVASAAIHVLDVLIINAFLSLGTGEIWFEVVTRGFYLLHTVLGLLGPIFMTIALLRPMPWNAEKLFGRVLLYAATLIVSGIVAVLAGLLLTVVMGSLSGQNESTTGAIGGILVAALAFLPIFRRVRLYIDRQPLEPTLPETID